MAAVSGSLDRFWTISSPGPEPAQPSAGKRSIPGTSLELFEIEPVCGP